jgi:hypothetical protein
MNAIDTLRLNAHLPIKPFLTTSQPPQESKALLKFARTYHFL